ncbi:MAG: cytochrome C oxidase subunit IV family protein [bacterium]
MAHHSHAEGEAHPEVGHVVPVRYLVGAGLALIVLTAITVASHSVDMGEANLPVALAIAMVKAVIVALIFMHLRWDRPFNLLVLIGSIVFVLLLIAFASMDVQQYEPTIFTGNAPEAQATLDANAPGAPVARMKSPDM